MFEKKYTSLTNNRNVYYYAFIYNMAFATLVENQS